MNAFTPKDLEFMPRVRWPITDHKTGDNIGYLQIDPANNPGHLAAHCLKVAEALTGKKTRPIGRRDQDRVRGLAARLLRDSTDLSWSEVRVLIYGGHGTKGRHVVALEGAAYWDSTLESWVGFEMICGEIPLP